MQIDSLTEDIEQTANQDEACRRLRQIPGVGSLVATAVVASIGNEAAFHKGREFAAWLGLVPKQHSSGDKPKLLGISKRGNRYLRRMFIHGARAVVFRRKRDQSSLGQWMAGLEVRAACNVLVVAMANIWPASVGPSCPAVSTTALWLHPWLFPTRRSGLRFIEVCLKNRKDERTVPMACLRTCSVNRSSRPKA